MYIEIIKTSKSQDVPDKSVSIIPLSSIDKIIPAQFKEFPGIAIFYKQDNDNKEGKIRQFFEDNDYYIDIKFKD